MADKKLEEEIVKILDEICGEWKMSFDGIYKELCIEVVKRYINK